MEPENNARQLTPELEAIVRLASETAVESYDSMDDHLRELLKEYDIDPDDYEEEKENGKD